MVTMTQGSDIDWAVVSVRIQIDDFAPMTCDNPGGSGGVCVLEEFGDTSDDVWSVGDGFFITESGTDLCSSTCSIDVTIIDTHQGMVIWESMDDMDDGMDEMYYAFYCSNDGEDYAESMGGILCPEGPGEVPTCPDGMPCTCIDVDESCTDGDDDWGYLSDEPSDEMGDVEAPEIDFSLYDWNSTNFSMTVDLTNPESMFDFSADVTVEGVTHEIDIVVNEMFEVRAMTVHVEEYDETVTMTLHTEAEIADMLADGMVEGPAMEALPFTLEMAYMDDDMDHGDDEDWETMATDADGNPLFVTVLDCITLVDQAMLANSTFDDVVDSAMLDTSMCGNETDAYSFATNESHVIPTDVMLVDGDEEVGLMLSSDTITMYGLMFEGMPVNETKCG